MMSASSCLSKEVATATGPEHDIKLFQVNSDPRVEQPAWVPTGVTWPWPKPSDNKEDVRRRQRKTLSHLEAPGQLTNFTLHYSYYRN